MNVRRLYNVKGWIVLLCCIWLIVLVLLVNHSLFIDPRRQANSQYQSLTCYIEENRTIPCLQYKRDVYLPFNGFVRRRFDVSGTLSKGDFYFQTSDVPPRIPGTEKYNPYDKFGTFSSYHVEMRTRVKCLHPIHGIPMSVQWNQTPYFYPIQIAQFALQHYSCIVEEKSPRIVRSLITNPQKNVSHITLNLENDVYLFKLLNDPVLRVLSFVWTPLSHNSWFSIAMSDSSRNEKYQLNFKFTDDDRCVWPETHCDGCVASFTYSLGKQILELPLNFTMDFTVYTVHALLTRKSSHHDLSHLKSANFTPLTLTFHGPSLIPTDSLSQMNSAHQEMFLKSAQWFLLNQDKDGRWTTPISHKIANTLYLDRNWPSAMAQGHALSVLTRAYNLTRDQRFIESARKALLVFSKSADEGGIVNKLFDYDWFEEYPTTPGTHVLNGFLYSLIGLYDFSFHDNSSLAIFRRGIDTLKIFLPLFDTGQRSVYDLKHLTTKTEPNIARWEYHNVHIYLLKWLFKITNEKYFDIVANRWISYSYGYNSKHN